MVPSPHPQCVISNDMMSAFSRFELKEFGIMRWFIPHGDPWWDLVISPSTQFLFSFQQVFHPVHSDFEHTLGSVLTAFDLRSTDNQFFSVTYSSFDSSGPERNMGLWLPTVCSVFPCRQMRVSLNVLCRTRFATCEKSGTLENMFAVSCFYAVWPVPRE